VQASQNWQRTSKRAGDNINATDLLPAHEELVKKKKRGGDQFLVVVKAKEAYLT